MKNYFLVVMAVNLHAIDKSVLRTDAQIERAYAVNNSMLQNQQSFDCRKVMERNNNLLKDRLSKKMDTDKER
jgi:fructose/tagatose bisphosphate aldolase